MATTPSIYVGTYKKYNEGSIEGAWLNLEDYANKKEFYEAAAELHEDEDDPEFMFQDYEGFPKKYYSESGLDDKLWDWLALDEDDREILELYVDHTGNDDATIDDAKDAFMGTFDSEEDWAIDWIEQTGGLPKDQASYYITVSPTDARLIGVDEADSRVGDMSDEDVVKEADLEDEYEEATTDKEKDNIIDKARNKVSSDIADEVERKVSDDPVGYFVDELGAYSIADLLKANFVSIDYEKFARDAEMGGGMNFVRGPKGIYVFSAG
jgi:Antirestriction protein